MCGTKMMQRRLKNMYITFFPNCILLDNCSCPICLGNTGFVLGMKGKEYKKQERNIGLECFHTVGKEESLGEDKRPKHLFGTRISLFSIVQIKYLKVSNL